MKLGATGKFPRGSLGPEDEGELRMGVAHDIHGDVHISFGKSIMWFAMSSDDRIRQADPAPCRR
jgi:hypothetical protein